MQIIKYEDGKCEIWGRRLERHPNWSPRLPYLIDIASRLLPQGTLLDAELSHPEGRRFIPSLFTERGARSAQVLVFDVVFLNGEFLGDSPLERRKEALLSLKLSAPFFYLEYKPVIDLSSHLKEAVERGQEGIVLKELSSLYIVGKEAPIATEYWRKLKA
jgi:ATP-dependent DNA ligase